MQINKLTETFAAAPQIEPGDVPEIAALGYTTLICNRPDDEVLGQPPVADIEAAAKAAGLAFVNIPFAGMITPDALEAFDAAMDGASGPVLAFCRTGTRSTTIWALSQARTVPADDLITAAARGGYDLEPMKPMLMSRAGG